MTKSLRKSDLRILLSVVFCCLASCSEPRTQEYFIKAEEVQDVCGPYVFNVDLTDSLSSYDLVLYMRLDCSDREFETLTDYDATVILTSDDADTLKSHYLFRKSGYRRIDAFSRFYSGDFRRGFANLGVEYNRLTVSLDSIRPVGTLRGLGLRVSKTK